METKQYPDMECDVVIAGCGVAGLYAALNLPTSTRVIMLSKGAVDECDSMLAQGASAYYPRVLTTMPSLRTPCTPAITRTAARASTS